MLSPFSVASVGAIRHNETVLLLLWHVSRAWRDGIKRHIDLIDNQRAVYYQLHVEAVVR